MKQSQFTRVSLRTGLVFVSIVLISSAIGSVRGSEFGPAPVGQAELRLLTPNLVELSLVTTKGPPPARVTQWDLVGTDQQFRAPSAARFQVTIDGALVTVENIGFRRRPLYAPYKKRDLRIGNSLYLQLGTAATDGQTVEVRDTLQTIWGSSAPQRVVADPLRWSPAIHVSQAGYAPADSKKAFVGYYLGNLGEMEAPAGDFKILDARTRETVYQGALTLRKDVGYSYSPLPYQRVLQLDFSEVRSPGEYIAQVPGLGVSLPFRINEGVPALFARAYGLGVYHQRCGAANELPFTRHTHAPCHLARAEVPTMAYTAVNKALADFSKDYSNNPRHTAPQLKDISSSLYPFVNTGKVDVSGGHHDAGDYSKYTINVAQLIHALVFAVDAFPGVADLDNLGLPESSDGISDLLQEAKWEADFLAKMQDADGGFYFLVYPRNRPYEDNVLPDRGDPQVVFPKNTAATAAGVAALAQIASSPRFRQTYPDAAAAFLTRALKGWEFLQKAIAQHGRDGAYQKISHYGDEFMHDDELAWAAAELYAATGESRFQDELIGHFNPEDRNTRRFTWWRLFEGYGCAVRSYAFAARTGRLAASQLDPAYLAKCEAEIIAAADDQVRFAREHAYGSSFPDPNKSFRSAGWYFSVEQTFDIAVAYQLAAQQEYLDAIVGNMNYEGGCNPLNVVFLTGIGEKRQWEIVHQYAQNDRRFLPPSGIPAGNLQKTFSDLPLYPSELSGLCFPADNAASAPYAPYDVWGDTYNTTTEAVTPQQGRCLASMAWLMARSPVAAQPWKPAVAEIVLSAPNIPVGLTNTASLVVDGMDLSGAEIVWEGRNQAPVRGSAFQMAATFLGPQWVEAEALLPDGRRVFALGSFDAAAAHPITAIGPSRWRVAGVAGQEFVLESSLNLRGWTPVSTNVFVVDGFEFTDERTDQNGQRFYRAVAAP